MTVRLSYVACGLAALALAGVVLKTQTTVGSSPVEAQAAPEAVDPTASPSAVFEVTSVDLGEMMQDATLSHGRSDWEPKWPA